MRWMILISLMIVLINGCTTPVECPTINCPQQNCDTQPVESLVEVSGEPITIYKYDMGTEVYFVIENKGVDIVNCGKEAYSPLVVEAIKHSLSDLNLRNLILSNTSVGYIGGCKDLVITFPEIEQVLIYGGSQDTREYNEFITWTPPNKLVIKEGSYELPLGRVVDKNV